MNGPQFVFPLNQQQQFYRPMQMMGQAPMPAGAAASPQQGLLGGVGGSGSLLDLINQIKKNQQNGSQGTGLLTGIGNWLQGNSWDGMAAGQNLQNLDQQAQINLANGAPL